MPTKPIYNPHPYSMLVEARIMFETGMGLVEDAMRDKEGCLASPRERTPDETSNSD